MEDVITVFFLAHCCTASPKSCCPSKGSKGATHIFLEPRCGGVRLGIECLYPKILRCYTAGIVGVDNVAKGRPWGAGRAASAGRDGQGASPMGPWGVLKEAGKGDCRVRMGIVFLCPASHPLYGCPDAEAQQPQQGSL